MIILVPSCLAYSDAWGPFSALKKKFWSDCEYPTHLVTDSVVSKDHGFGSIISTGSDLGWCRNLLSAVKKFEVEDFILVLQEDFFFSSKVDNSLVENALNLLKSDPCAAMVRLMPCPGPDKPFDLDFGIIDYDSPYRVSCQATIWRREVLMKILQIVDPSPTSFEIDGSRVLLANWNFYAAHRQLPFRFPYLVSAISRGQWNPDAIKLCEANNIPIDASRRPIEGVSK